MAKKRNHSFIFVVTYGRSGSTILQTLLQAIPGYFIRGENMNLLFPLYRASRAAHAARYTHGKNPHEPDDPWYGADQIVPENFTRRILETFVDEILQPPEDARVLGFKEIRFHEAGAEHFEPFLNFIHEHFPGCKFVFNTRPWEEVARSGWWANMPTGDVKDIITGADKLYADYMAKYPERGVHLRHEVTRENPLEFKRMFDFIGEPFDAEAVNALAGKRLGHSGV